MEVSDFRVGVAKQVKRGLLLSRKVEISESVIKDGIVFGEAELFEVKDSDNSSLEISEFRDVSERSEVLSVEVSFDSELPINQRLLRIRQCCHSRKLRI